jgi:hypothetical protein
VEAVSVSTLRPGTQALWDPVPDPADDSDCGLLGLTAGLSQPVTGKGSEYLCRVDTRPKHAPQHPSAPDLMVILSAGGTASYQTYTARDTVQHAFQSEFVIPVAAIPADGLSLIVRDRDGPGYEEIGHQRLTRQQLVMTALSASPGLTLGDLRSGLQRVDLSVVPYPPGGTGTHTVMDTRYGTIAAPFRAIRAGEVLEIVAGGSYRTGGSYEPWIAPAGYSSGGPEGYNFAIEPFHSAPHGSVIAVLGNGDARVGVVLGPCARFISNVSGPLVLGVNDTEPGNNEGQITFGLRVVNPTPEEWWYGQTNPCKTL